jgi:beta-phosphoglucomutase
MNRYDAILFDFDGVLADTEPVHFACWREVLAPFGIDLTWPVYVERCIGVADQEMLNFLSTLASPPAQLDILWSEYKNKKDLFKRRVADHSPIHPATVALVKSLANYKLAVVSSSGRSEIEPILQRAGIIDCFGVLVFGDDVTKFKPHPEPYQKAAASLNVIRPLVVEDSEAGATSGRAAGFDVLKLDHPRNLARAVEEAIKHVNNI